VPDLPEHCACHQWLQHEQGVDPGEIYGGLAGFGGAAELHQTTWCTEMAIRSRFTEGCR